MGLVIAAAQLASVAGDVPRNLERHWRFAKLASERGVQLLVFPELSLTGYELGLARANVMEPEDPRFDRLRRLAIIASMTTVVGAPVANSGGGLYIGALAFRPDGTVSVYSKVHVHSSEAGVFESGLGGMPLAIGETQAALAICRDAATPGHAALAAASGANLYAAGAMITEDAYERKAGLLQGYAEKYGIAVLLANYSGATGGEISAGRSAIWAEDGTVVAASTGTEESLVIATQAGGTWTGCCLPVSA